MEPFRHKGYSMELWSTFIFKSVYSKLFISMKQPNIPLFIIHNFVSSKVMFSF